MRSPQNELREREAAVTAELNRAQDLINRWVAPPSIMPHAPLVYLYARLLLPIQQVMFQLLHVHHLFERRHSAFFPVTILVDTTNL